MAKRKKNSSHLGAVIAITLFLVIIFAVIAVLAWLFLFKEG